MLNRIKNHKWAVLLAFLSAIIVAFPQFYFPCDHSEAYRGIYIATTDNEHGYLSRVQEVRDGHPSLGSVFLKDGKDDPYIQPPLSEILVAYLGKMFFLDLNNTILLARFLFAFLVFLVVYGFVFFISKEKLIALAASSAVCLANSLISPRGIFALLQGEPPGTTFLTLYRPVQPQVSFLFFFGFLLFFWLFFDALIKLNIKKLWIWGAVSTLILGLSFYIYPYTWTFLYAFLGVFFLILIFQKKWQDAKRTLYVVFGGIIISIPYFLNTYEASLHPHFWEIIIRFRYIVTRQPIFGFLVPSLFVIFLVLFPKKWKSQFIFSLALLIAPFIVLNQQLITGRVLSIGHYHWYFHQPLAIIFLIIILLYQTKLWQDKLKLFKSISVSKILAFLIIGVSIYTGIVIQISSYQASENKILSEQRYAPVVEWLNVNAEKEEVVLAASELPSILSIYTFLNQFSPDYHYLSASNERILNSLFLFYRLDGVKGEEAKDLFLQEEERKYISGSVYNTHYENLYGSTAAIPDQVLYSFAEKYQDFLLIPIDKFLEMHEVKYVIWDTRNYPRWDLDQYHFLNKVYEEGDFIIYKN